MLISFIIPAYNAEKYIERCLSSVCELNNKYIEIIVVDDGSKDHTAEIVKKFILEHPKVVKLICKQNEGVSVARNVGLKAAQGKYIGFIDSDDEIKSEEFYKLLSILQYDYDCVMFGYDVIDLQYTTKFPPIEEGLYGLNVIRDLENRLLDFVISKNQISLYMGGKVYQYLVKKQILMHNHVQFPNHISYAEDMCFVLEMFRNLNNIYICNISAYKYYVNTGSAMHRYNNQFWSNWKMVIDYLQTKYNDEYDFTNMIICNGIGSINHYMEYVSISNICKIYQAIREVMQDECLQNALAHLKNINWTKNEMFINRCIKDEHVGQFMIFKICERIVYKLYQLFKGGNK